MTQTHPFVVIIEPPERDDEDYDPEADTDMVTFRCGKVILDIAGDGRVCAVFADCGGTWADGEATLRDAPALFALLADPRVQQALAVRRQQVGEPC